jgi:hypothetical protein
VAAVTDDEVLREVGGRPGWTDRTGGGAPAGRDLPLDHVRRIAVLLETAAVLEGRASRTSNAAYAGVLRERAAQRRETAAQLRAGLWRSGRHAVG